MTVKHFIDKKDKMTVCSEPLTVELLGVGLCFLVYNNFCTISRDKAHVFKRQRNYASHQYT